MKRGPTEGHYFVLDLSEGEKLERTEPAKQGPWETRSYASWILEHTLVPGFHELVEKAYRTKRRT